MSIETMTKLATVTVGAGGSATIDFTNIPQTYTDLVLKVSARGTVNTASSGHYYTINLNGSTTNKTQIYFQGSGSSSGSGSTSSFTTYMDPSEYTASTFSNAEVYLPNYTGSNYKSMSVDVVMENNATEAYNTFYAQLWSNTAAITSITLTPGGGNFAQYSTATLYGIKNARKTAGNSIKATGGNISFDGTYVYHTFTSTSSFATTSNLTAEVLVVAGGGGGGGGGASSPCGGGGGAGGLRYFSSQYLSGTYTVTVGAGGSGGAAGTAGNGSSGTQGNSSQFGSLTATTGGGYGARSSTGSGVAGGNGGSGGGAGGGGGGSTTAALGTAGEGNNGGIWSGSGNEAAGGGGAGGVGSNSLSYVPGAADGGAGLTYFGKDFAGGGGGGHYYSAYGLATKGGGRGGYGYVGSSGSTLGATGANNGVAGAGGTGGGGGGGAGYLINSVSGTGGNGGSGTVIIRYKA